MYRSAFQLQHLQLRSAAGAIRRLYAEGGSPAGRPSASTVLDVPGLSSAVVRQASAPVGPDVEPNKSGAYKVPEYFCYNNMSYFEAEVEMLKHRLPQPSALKK